MSLNKMYRLSGTIMRFIKGKVDSVLSFLRSVMYGNSQNEVQADDADTNTVMEPAVDSPNEEINASAREQTVCRSRYDKFIRCPASEYEKKRERSREPSCIPGKQLVRLMLKCKTVRSSVRKHVRKFVPKSSIFHEHIKRSGVLFTRLTNERGSFNCTRQARLIRKKIGMHRYRRHTAKQKLSNPNGPLLTTVYKSPIHQFSYKKRVLANDIETNPGPRFVNSLKTVKGDFHQGKMSLFGNNAGKQCVAMSLTAVVYNVINDSCDWRSEDMNFILRTGDSLYSSIHKLIGTDYLLLTDVPGCLSLNESSYLLQYSDCISGDLHMLEAKECYVPLKLAFSSLKGSYPAYLLTVKSNTVAVFHSRGGSYKCFDSHSRDVHGNVHCRGTSVLLQFEHLEALIRYLQDMYPSNSDSVVPFETRAVTVVSALQQQLDVLHEGAGVSDDAVASVSGENSSGAQRKRNIACATENTRDPTCSSPYEPLPKRVAQHDEVTEQRQEKRKAGLQKRRENHKEKTKNETPEKRSIRLQKRRENDRKTRNNETEEERAIRLQKRTVLQ